MLSENMRGVYGRLSVLCLLSVCLIVFISSDNLENVYAAPCVEECEGTWATCIDACPDDCSTTDANCSSCTQACNFQYWNCMSHAVFCNTGVSNNPNCQVEFGTHEENGGGSHQGYYQICTHAITHQGCVACPYHEICPGAGGLPPCY